MKLLGKKQWDMFLFIAAIAIFAVFIICLFFRNPPVRRPARTVLNVSSHFTELFGADIAKTVILEYEEQNPHMQVHLVNQGSVPETESAPDIIFFDDDTLSGLVKASALASLDPYMYSGERNGTTQLALPLVSFVDLFFYNIDILAVSGRIRPPKTRAELHDTAKAVSAQDGVFPLALGLGAGVSHNGMNQAVRRAIYPWIWADGPAILDRGSLSKAAANTIIFINQLNREGLLEPGIFEKTGSQYLGEFAEGKIAMIAASSRHLPYLRQQGINLGVTALPATAVGKNRLGLSRIYAGISANCALPDEAWAFLNLIAGKSQVLAQALGAVPGSYPANFPGEYIKEDELLSKAWEIFVAAEIAEFQTGTPEEEETARLILERINQVFGK